MEAGSAFAAFVSGLDQAGMPLIVLGMRRAKPAVTLITEDCGGFVAGFVQAGDTFTVWACF
jgi:hypothetical protein